MRENDLGNIDAAFAGFKLFNGEIILPNGLGYPPGYLYAIAIRQQQLNDLRREIKIPRQLLL